MASDHARAPDRGRRRHCPRHALAILPLAGTDATRQLGVVWRRRSVHSADARALATFLRRYLLACRDNAAEAAA
ncbi:MAG: hypothetical protein HPM95_20780 [Alphaproteobacteria bacterium]|nr:hypothetical protein [Alphaproteobacteria bacterium]